VNEEVFATTPVTTNSPATVEAAAPGAAPSVEQPAAEPVAAPHVAPVRLTPERYDLALEGFSIDPALVQHADPVLRDIGLSNDAANKLLPVARDIMARTQESVVRQIEDAAAAQKQSWHAAFVADPEIGGARRSETEHFAAKALDALGYAQGHPFRVALDTSGFGNHPDMIRAFRRLGELVGEDGSFVRPTTAPSRNRPVWERLYPNEAG
jgi:hypothetical protein